MKETITTLGKLLGKNHDQHRDAVHIAVMPVVAGEPIRPGERLRIKFGTDDVVLCGEYNDDYVGRADPFIEAYEIKTGEKFWMWLRPGTITGLRHEWTHRTIDAEKKPLSDSETWLREFAEKWNFNYNAMIEAAQEKGSYITARGRDLHSANELDEGDEELFWYHISKLTGKKFNTEHKKGFCWSCTC